MATESLRPRFEVTYSEKLGTQQKSMKRLAVVVQPGALGAITSALREMGLASTIYDADSSTREKEKESLIAGRGSRVVELEFSSRKIVATVINSEDIEEVVSRMKQALKIDRAVVLVSAVEDLLMI